MLLMCMYRIDLEALRSNRGRGIMDFVIPEGDALVRTSALVRTPRSKTL